ncbi:hypothetical protein ODZ83_02155 [Acaricomes phytoseiuli]|uniref:hypothetical protein n=1 Tax=Acaricomes phytoseiuli TaxID=291968 RepID=UPI002221D545|nr:hypothetical protein [Acaricomes phytoseiuli]MCW1249006.1 hypothetical protein [Acaricomes phytoseiuli]
MDSVTFLGSAGIDRISVPNAEAMNVVKDSAGKPEVYVTTASMDSIAGIGTAGSWGAALFNGPVSPNGELTIPRFDPGGSWFGGKNFSSEGGYDPETGKAYWQTTGHNTSGSPGQQIPNLLSASEGHGYLDIKTESAWNTALISTGHGDRITPLIPLEREYIIAGRTVVDLGPIETDRSPDELRGREPRSAP